MLRLFKFTIALLYITLIPATAQTIKGPKGEEFTRRVIAQKLSDPWEITYGPDNHLWVTEAKGYKISRIDPESGKRTVLLDLSQDRQFPRYDQQDEEQSGGKRWPQGGLMGLALHPELLQGKPYVYLAYIYEFKGADKEGDGCEAKEGGCYYTTRLVRYAYDVKDQKLTNPEVLCDTIPASNDHNSGRLTVAPVAGQNYLFLTVGDMGAGQYANGGRPNKAQNSSSYEGKVLRFNLEPDADKGQFGKWIPNDNPFTSERKQNAVWSTGHRNAQGLAYAEVNGTGYLYSSEHGPFSDDELNIIYKGKNYGHPLIIGYNDGNYDGLAAGTTPYSFLPGTWQTTYPTIRSEAANAKALGAAYQDPIKSLYPHPNKFLKSVMSKIKADTDKPDWPSEAPSSLSVYTAAAIPGWQNSLLIPSLKNGKLFRLQLNAKGNGITGDTLSYFKAPIRYRDIAISPDGTRLYLSTDSVTVTSGPSEEAPPDENACSGCIMEFTYKSGGTPGSKEAARKQNNQTGLLRQEQE
ncbi:PQQ-dependent sugar dehydrogenase [Pontibacter sp. 13R65]|uniref:PQQ-dependent sugar dehydrogenase n=1 Tax=Pontibacter sp. 13R65 TaxID=3127458 RepID=UPI00301D2716